jgi:hypothetical protein
LEEQTMPIFAVLLEDNPEHAADIRRRHMPAHLDFLNQNTALIRAAGPLHDVASGQPAGGLWLVAADDANTVVALTQDDPFWAAGLRRSIRILEWRQVFADGKRLT